MTAKTQAALNTQADTDIPDNTTQLVDPADVRGMIKDIIDSMVPGLGGTLSAGFIGELYDAGTKSSGTFTPDPLLGLGQQVVNGGAHTLAPPSTNEFASMLILYTNNASAGAITTSGFTKADVASLTTTDEDSFLFYITKIGSFSRLIVEALP